MNQTTFHSQALAQIELQIIEQEKKLQALKEERNGHLAPVRLPAVVLTEIFLYVVQCLHETFHPPKFQLSISHVCRYWRTVVLRSQEFWRYQPVNGDGMLWSSQMIERAEGKPLHLRMDADEHHVACWDSSAFESITPTLAHAASMSIRLSDAPRTSRDYLVFFPSCPNLESAAVLAESTLFYEEIPDDLFGEDLPRLRQLSLHHVFWGWLAPYFAPSLTYLSLRGSFEFDEDVEETLCQLSSLRYLEMENTFPVEYLDLDVSDDNLPDSTKSIKFPHLQELRLGGDPTPTAFLVNQFDFPASTKLDFRCKYYETIPPADYDFSNFEEFDWLSTWISRRFKGLEEARDPPRALQVREPNQGLGFLVRLRFWTSSQILDGLSEPLATMKPQVELDLSQESRGEGSLHYFQSTLWRITSHLPLSEIEYLHLDTIPLMECPNTVFGALSGVRILHISGHFSALDLLEVLTPRSAKKVEESDDTDDEESNDTDDVDSNNTDDGDAALQSPLLPMVHTVILQNAVLEGSNRTLTFVEQRILAGCAIRTFRVSECRNVSPVWLQELRKKVAGVEWDGVGEINLS